MTDLLTLEVHDLHVNVLTGIYSQETHLPQPLHISVSADLEIAPHYTPDTPLAATEFPEGVHFTLIEALADHIIGRLFSEDDRFTSITVKIIKLAISEDGESIGLTMTRHRKPSGVAA